MRRGAVKIVLFMLLPLFVSCKVDFPENVLSPEKMEAVLYDYHLTSSMATTIASADYKEKLMYSYVYEKHKISKEQFDSSLVWYNRYPKHIKRIYENIEARLQSEIDVLKLNDGINSRNVDLELANLTGSVAELWTGHTVRMLSPTPLTNKVQFSFDVPKESSFVAGDSIVFSFNTVFVPGSDVGIKQQLHTALTLEYGNGTSLMMGADVPEAGECVVAAPRCDSVRLKSMSGYVYYFDNDSLSASFALISNISLRRFHPADSILNK